jgi:hypothetical protein
MTLYLVQKLFSIVWDNTVTMYNKSEKKLVIAYFKVIL